MESTGETWRLGHRPALDGLRGVAVLLVVLSHVRLLPLSAGMIGVTVFFVLSGFLIATLLFQELEAHGRVRLGRFYRRRAYRLLPALYAVTLTSVLLTLVSGVPLVTRAEVVGAATYSTNILAVWVPPRVETGALHHTWSLVLEEQFYLVWPAVTLLLWRRRALLMALLSTAVVFVILQRFRLVDSQAGPERVLYGTDVRLDGILIGCLLAVGLRSTLPVISRITVTAGLAAVVLASLAPVLPGYLFGILLSAIGTVAVILGVLAGTEPRWLSGRLLVAVGKRSYGLYLWHHVVLIAAGHTPLRDQPWALTTTVILLSAALTELSWRYIEEPFLRLKDGMRGARLGTRKVAEGASGVASGSG